MRFGILFSLLFSMVSASILAEQLVPTCKSEIYFDDQIGAPVKSLAELEESSGSHPKYVQLKKKRNFFDPEIMFQAKFDFRASDSKPSAYIEIHFGINGSDIEQKVRRDIHHTELKSGAKFSVAMLPHDYGGFHYFSLECLLK